MLATGATNRTGCVGGESARLSIRLLRLLKAGRVARIKQANRPNLWTLASDAEDEAGDA
jgi:hypothetical protein